MQISAQMKQQRGCEAAPAFEYALDNLILHRYNTKIPTKKKVVLLETLGYEFMSLSEVKMFLSTANRVVIYDASRLT